LSFFCLFSRALQPPLGGKSDPVKTPLKEALLDLYQKNAGVVYVMHAKPGLGKFLQQGFIGEFVYVFSEQHLKGFMVTDTDLDEDYCSSCASLLGARNVQGWMRALLFALDAPKNKQPNISYVTIPTATVTVEVHSATNTFSGHTNTR
jgi:hypothetical protein